MRIVSLLPSITETIASLGRYHQLVGRSHECDFPEEIKTLPSCTEPKFDPDGTSYELNERVEAILQEGLSVYRVDADRLRELNPDIVLTQDHCKVCATSLEEVKEAVRSSLDADVEIISVSPDDLSSVVSSIRTIATAINAEKEGEKLVADMKEKLQNIQKKTLPLHPPEVLCLEWLDPLMSAGNWMPELLQLAGGQPVLAKAGEHSSWLEWKKIQQSDPEIITITPCGYSISETLSEWSTLTNRPGWNQLKAVQNHQVYIMDGNHYFNRPGPRLVDSTRILAEIIHPSIFRENAERVGWINVYNYQFQQNINSSFHA
ncbi:cobalamin-binding protein [Aliifodinibius salicampi]|uniref:Cobalamin-binding protein n=1 Tax=Fodinibius salicampi TaxID=1920655 RepID=A0ABT3PZ60_9BACT|nr:cobalamin-binding protein [Fodinibius salicampi]MCW9713118.1 cobalamin-binding protein [Fodinibius salicampi]